MKTNKILILIDSLVRGGKERRLIELLKGLRSSSRFEAELVIFSKRVEYEEVFELNIPIHFLERVPKKDPKVFPKFYTLCKDIQPDLVHSWGPMTSIYAAPTIKLLNIRFLNALIADAPENLTFKDKRYLRRKITFPFSDVILSNSHAGLAAYKVPKQLGVCIHNGFDFHRLDNLIAPAKIREQYNISTPFVVGMVGNFGKRKDYKTFLQAGMELIKDRDDVSFITAGGGRDLEKMQALVPPVLKHRIIFTGLISHVESLVNTFTIGVLTSNKDYHGEGISNAIMEYMALKKPVIATDCQGTKEIVHHGKNGYLISNKDKKTLKSYISQLLDSPLRAQQMGDYGAKLLRKSFDLTGMVDKYIKLYDEMLKREFSPTTPIVC